MELRGYSDLSQAKLAEHIAKNCNISLEELEKLVNSFIEQKLIGKIYSAKDHFLLGKVKIEYFDDELIIVTSLDIKLESKTWEKIILSIPAMKDAMIICMLSKKVKHCSANIIPLFWQN